ncbi:MAG: hypothetical protein CVV64_11560 [Candidatus Wallbacteria bacterium HGW-Wallbacteria-1]|jgi:MFS family permease|uniref:Major facilitator superfamily (MFS) profile domain-containing protein n=1 Tax=Candidatus Wallbacteria bacterium HGW-Wallbacteria-1 TaxID=2013854 RepID=A0A2N1PNV8_9BACT|nr:MAG: hypothetical protein CVV64_11560 [Candidatus Wallbacteria bacterium HGW-Wallbacteria-1]
MIQAAEKYESNLKSGLFSSDEIKPLWTFLFISLAFSGAFLFFSFELLMPTLPVYFSAIGGTDSQVGLIMGSFTFSAFAVRIFLARLAEKFGRNNLLKIGLSICLLSTALYYWAQSILLGLSVRILHGFGFGIATTILATLVADILPRQRRGEGIGYFGLFTTLAFAMAPFTGLWVLKNYDFGHLFSLATFLCFMAILLFMTIGKLVPESVEKGSGMSGGRSEVSGFSGFYFPGFLTLLMGICLGSVICFIPLHARNINFQDVGFFYLTSTGFVFITRLFSGKVYDRLGHMWTLVPGSLFLFLALRLISSATNAQEIVLGAAFNGLGMGLLFPSLQAWMISLAPPSKRVSVNAVFFNSLDIGVGLGALGLGFIAEKSGYAMMYSSASMTMILFLVVLLTGNRLITNNNFY